MSPLIRNLMHFNRKERFHLLRAVLGDSTWPSRDSFRLAESFRKALGEKLGLTIPPDAFATMDYQLDRLYAALYLALHPTELQAPIPQPPGGWLNTTQEDIDLLVAFDDPGADGDRCQLVLIEAKCETGWTNRQLRSKLEHLRRIDHELGFAQHRQFRLHLVLTSPRYSEGLAPDCSEFPWLDWRGRAGQRYHWMALPVGEHWQAERCDARGKKAATGSHWRVRVKRAGGSDLSSRETRGA